MPRVERVRVWLDLTVELLVTGWDVSEAAPLVARSWMKASTGSLYETVTTLPTLIAEARDSVTVKPEALTDEIVIAVPESETEKAEVAADVVVRVSL